MANNFPINNFAQALFDFANDHRVEVRPPAVPLTDARFNFVREHGVLNIASPDFQNLAEAFIGQLSKGMAIKADYDSQLQDSSGKNQEDAKKRQEESIKREYSGFA